MPPPLPRHRVLLFASLISLPVTLGQVMLGQAGLWRALWQVVCVALCVVMGRALEARRNVGAWPALPVALVLLAPVTMLLDGPSPLDRLVLCFVPLVIAVLFFDRFGVVVASLTAGAPAVAGFLAALDTPLAEVVSVVWSYGGVALVFGVTCHWLMGTREAELESEHQRSQALRLSETRRAQAERLAIVGRLAAGVAHEINNPLAYVKANIGVLRRDLFGEGALSEAEALEVLDETKAGIERICQIVLDLKSFAREGRDEVEPVDLKDLVDGAVRLASVRLPPGVKVTVRLDRLMLVRANRRKLSQVVLNLLVNAGEAMEDARTPAGRIVVHGELVSDGFLLHVDDTGPGLPDEVLQRLFEPFFTTKGPGKGTGLGLALSREYLAGFGATVRASNRPTGGARFTLHLRLALVTGETPLPRKLVA
ncbi:MAG: ATP-binding protein [Myxococcaceae bacterium]|nr:ATP-binding protein [Myxococcaceae bacterium]